MKSLSSYLLSRGLLALSPDAAPPPVPPVVPPAPDPAAPPPPAVDPPAPVDPPAAPPVPPADPPAPVVPPAPPADAAAKLAVIKNALKLPENPVLDADSLDRTAAIASELGLSPEHAQKALDFVHQEVAAQKQAILDAHAPGTGAAWKAQDQAWRTEALADPVLGGNKPEQLEANVGLAKRVLATFGDDASIGFLETSGLGSHPGALRLLVKIGKAMGEGALVMPSVAPKGVRTETDVADSLYTSMKDTP